MRKQMLPFNVELMKLTPEIIKSLPQVTSTDYFERANGELHDEGLFSISLFGRIGDELRDLKFAYIDLKVEILHPAIYDALVRIRALYRDILAGTAYVQWDEQLKDFVNSNELDGHTGYGYFMTHFPKLVIEKNQSVSRNVRVDLINKYRDRCMIRYALVLPAGLRDIEEDEMGRMKYDEINGFYRKLIAISNSISANDHNNADIYDNTRHSLQLTFNSIYSHLENLLSGKNGFYQKKWGSRRVFNSTRNVISAMDVSKLHLDDDTQVKFTDTVVGLYQSLKGTQPLAIHSIRNKYLSKVFMGEHLQAQVVDKDTLEARVVAVSPKEYDTWMSVEGLEKVLTRFGEASIRNKPITLGGHYLALVYAPPGGKYFRIFHDIRELPEGLDRKHVKPVNYIELFYASCLSYLKDSVAYATRYPVLGIGGIYPSTVYVKTTLTGSKRFELDDNWQPIKDVTYPEWPEYDTLAYYDVMAVHPSRLSLLGADHDGDTLSFTFAMSQEAIHETNSFLKRRSAWVNAEGGLNASINTETVALVFRNMTMDPIH